jgi:hypothetical protein
LIEKGTVVAHTLIALVWVLNFAISIQTFPTE